MDKYSVEWWSRRYAEKESDLDRVRERMERLDVERDSEMIRTNTIILDYQVDIKELKSDLDRVRGERNKPEERVNLAILDYNDTKEELTKLREVVRGAVKVVGLLNSMVEGREDHSEQSQKAVSDFFELV